MVLSRSMKNALLMAFLSFGALHLAQGQNIVANGDFSQGFASWIVLQPPSNQILTGTLAQIQFAGETNLSEAFAAQPGAGNPIDLEQIILPSLGTQYSFYADVAGVNTSSEVNEDLGTVVASINGTDVASISFGAGVSQFGTLNGVYIPAQSSGELLVLNFSRGIGRSPIDYIGNISLTPLPFTATAAASVSNGFVVGANVTYGGYNYTNVPIVSIVGGNGVGAQAVAVVSNGVVTAINVMNAGIGYTGNPQVVIQSPFVLTPTLNIAPMTFLTFSNLTIGATYQMQHSLAWYWTNLPVSFTATNTVLTEMLAGVVQNGAYRIALNPVPSQAFATSEVVNGFVVGVMITSGGSGYVTAPIVSIVGGGGTNATAMSRISESGVVTNITITSAGIGYTNLPTIQISQPPAGALSPLLQPVMRLDSANLAQLYNYQVQFMPSINGKWENWNGGLFTPTAITNSQFTFITNGAGFFRVQYAP